MSDKVNSEQLVGKAVVSTYYSIAVAEKINIHQIIENCEV